MWFAIEGQFLPHVTAGTKKRCPHPKLTIIKPEGGVVCTPNSLDSCDHDLEPIWRTGSPNAHLGRSRFEIDSASAMQPAAARLSRAVRNQEPAHERRHMGARDRRVSESPAVPSARSLARSDKGRRIRSRLCGQQKAGDQWRGTKAPV